MLTCSRRGMCSNLACCTFGGKGVVHRDLKLENTLLHIEGDHAPRIKICDFGYSKSMRYHSLPNSTVGTPAYIAPEVFTIVLGEGAYSGEVNAVSVSPSVSSMVSYVLNALPCAMTLRVVAMCFCLSCAFAALPCP